MQFRLGDEHDEINFDLTVDQIGWIRATHHSDPKMAVRMMRVFVPFMNQIEAEYFIQHFTEITKDISWPS